jgi:hypothetical protein
LTPDNPPRKKIRKSIKKHSKQVGAATVCQMSNGPMTFDPKFEETAVALTTFAEGGPESGAPIGFIMELFGRRSEDCIIWATARTYKWVS